MTIVPKQDGSFSVKMNDDIFLEGQNAQSINILVQGKVDVFVSPFEDMLNPTEEDHLKKSYRVFSVAPNVFIGASDLFLSGKYSYRYRAAEDTVIYMHKVQNIEQMTTLFNTKKEYAAYTMTSISQFLENAYETLTRLENFVKVTTCVTDNLSMFFLVLKERYDFTYKPTYAGIKDSLGRLKHLKTEGFSFPLIFDAAFFEKRHIDYEDTMTEEIDIERMEYYKHVSNIPLELRKSFFGADMYITRYNCMDAAALLSQVQDRTKAAFAAADTLIKMLYSENEACIFTEYVAAVREMGSNHSDTTLILQTLDYIVSKINEIVSLYDREYAHKIEIDLNQFGNKYFQAMMAAKGMAVKETPSLQAEVKNAVPEKIPEELKNSALKILDYSGISRDRAELFMKNLDAFKRSSDKLSDDEDLKKIRSESVPLFFEVYEAVFKKVLAQNNKEKLYQMFLNYAYMDENLLSPNHVTALYELADKPNTQGMYSVYSGPEWLYKIYNKEKEPSVNEFSMDYHDVFRDMKKRGEADDADKPAYDNNLEGRLNFEISNMFMTNHKLCNSHVHTYFPVLFDEIMTKDFKAALVTPAMIEEGLNRILQVDFSAFHREVSYFDMKKGIEKEFIMKSVLPDIILMPTYGANAIMWQEISGRNRNTPGRFIFPIFCDGNLDEMLIELVGNFRWELCKTIMGAAWTDISIKSITSEYTDYVQFYKKNKDLSEETKEKLRKQLQRCKNVTRDVFVSDYNNWINYECKGAVRLTKQARDILYTHCPFSKEIRDELTKHPMFNGIATRFALMRTKQVKDLENRYARYVKTDVPLDSVLTENLKFYKEW